jgi:hypothetical protein
MLDMVALIDHYNGQRGVLPYLEAILDEEAAGAFSTITELELWQGIRPGKEERHEDLAALLQRVPLDGTILLGLWILHTKDVCFCHPLLRCDLFNADGSLVETAPLTQGRA